MKQKHSERADLRHGESGSDSDLSPDSNPECGYSYAHDCSRYRTFLAVLFSDEENIA